MKKRKIKTIVIILLVFAILAGGGTGAWFMIKNGGKPVRVFAVSDVAQTDLWMDEPQYDGTVRAENLQSLYLSSTQQLKEVFVKAGDTVKKGDRLAAFDTTLSDLELERQEIEVDKLELNLQNQQAELRRINGLKPYTPPKPAPEPSPAPAPQPLEPVELPMLLRGDGTEDSPFVYLWNDGCLYDDAFLETILPLKEAETTTAETTTAETTTEAETDADEETSGETEPPAPLYEEGSVTVVFQVRESDNPKGELLRAWGMTFDRHADGGYSFTVFQPDESFSETGDEPETAPPETEPEPDEGGYTAAEIARMRTEQQREIRETETKLKVERLKLKKLQLEIDTGVVTAALDGVVKYVATEEEARSEGKPVVTVSAGGAWYVTANVGELALEDLSVGDEAEIRSWMTDGVCTGRVTEISRTPAVGYYGGDGNPNVSYYPVTVEADASAVLQEGDYVSVSFGGHADSSGLYLDQPFIRTENGRSYVYALGGNDRLERREIVTGKVLWGSTVEIAGGLSMDDYIAFPYGKDVKPGAKTEISDISALYEY